MSDSVFSGKLKFVDIEGGIWYLVTEAATYVLDTSAIPASKLQDDHPLTVSGSVKESIGISMTGNSVLVADSVQ